MKTNSNLGSTNLKRKRRNENPILDYDRLPKELRKWIANAELPWRPKSVLKAYERAYSRTSNNKKAMNELSLSERIMLKQWCKQSLKYSLEVVHKKH